MGPSWGQVGAKNDEEEEEEEEEEEKEEEQENLQGFAGFARNLGPDKQKQTCPGFEGGGWRRCLRGW